MKTLSTLSLIGALALSTTAFADDTTPAPASSTPSAAQQCRTERSAMGVELFRQTYGTNKNKHNAFGKCVSKRTHATREDDAAAFALKYGTGRHGANAHGKCVSQKAKSKTAKAVDDQVDADVKAAKACKTERKADPAAFANKYGTNRNKRNAFGRCVSKQAKTL